MNFEYSKLRWSRGGAWRQLTRHNDRAVYTDAPYRFLVRNHDFRKNHSDPDFWCWTAARLSLDSTDVLFEAPCAAPFGEDYEYVWDVWLDRFSGQPMCGFIAVGLVRGQDLTKAQVEDALVEQDRRMVSERGGVA